MALCRMKLKARGTRPFLFHHLGIGFLSTDRKALSGSTGNNPDEWKTTVLHTESGQLYIPSSYIFGSFKNASAYTKVGRGTLTKKMTATLIVNTETVLMDKYLPEEKNLKVNDSTQEVYLDVRTVKNPSTKGSNLRYRVAVSKGYEFEFEIAWDTTIISDAHMQNVARDAGTLVGIGDGRSIGYGRFEILDAEFLK